MQSEAAKRLLERWDNFNAGNANYEEAYNNLAKYAREDWEALRAALSTHAEPVKTEPYGYAFQHEDTGLKQVVDVQQVEWGFERNNPRWQKLGPVYLHQPSEMKTAPAVAVKALRWNGPNSMGEYHSVGGLWGYIIRAGNGNGFWLTEIGDYFPSVEEAKAAAQADYKARIRSALSAQVQDVATPEGWQLVPKEPTASQLKDAAYSLMVKYGPEFVASNLTASRIYAELVAAAPATKQGEGE